MKYTFTHLMVIDLRSKEMLKLAFREGADSYDQERYIADVFNQLVPGNEDIILDVLRVHTDEKGNEAFVKPGISGIGTLPQLKKLSKIAGMPALFYISPSMDDLNERNSILITPDMSAEKFKTMYDRIMDSELPVFTPGTP